MGGYNVAPIANVGLSVTLSGISLEASGRVSYRIKKGWWVTLKTIFVSGFHPWKIANVLSAVNQVYFDKEFYTVFESSAEL